MIRSHIRNHIRKHIYSHMNKYEEVEDDGLFHFTNTGATLSPYIEVAGTPDILWTWADGTTDNKANPDDVTCIGDNTLSVSDWDAVTVFDFRDQHLTGELVTKEWPEATKIYFHINSYLGNIQIFPWIKAERISFRDNDFTSISGSLQTQIKMILCYFNNNAISLSAQIDKAMSDLVVNAGAAGRTAVCNVNFSGINMSGPTSAGTVNKDILVNTYSWTVTLNPEV